MQVEQIKKKINELKLLERNYQDYKKSYRTRFRELLYEIEELGGFIALGYTSATKFYKNEFGRDGRGTISRHNSAKDFEVLLGIPIGYYEQKDIEGWKRSQFWGDNKFKGQFVFNQPAQKNSKQPFQGKYCSIELAEDLRNRWQRFCQEMGTDKPKLYPSKSSFNKKVERIKELEKNLEKATLAQSKLRELEEKLKATKEELESVEEEVKMLQHELKEERKENRRLKNRIKKLERGLVAC